MGSQVIRPPPPPPPPPPSFSPLRSLSYFSSVFFAGRRRRPSSSSGLVSNIAPAYTRTVSFPYVPGRTTALVALTYVRIASLVALLATVAGTSVAPGRGHRGTRCTYARTHAGRGHFGRARSRAHARTCATRACSLCGSINCARAFARTHGRAISQLRTYVSSRGP